MSRTSGRASAVIQRFVLGRGPRLRGDPESAIGRTRALDRQEGPGPGRVVATEPSGRISVNAPAEDDRQTSPFTPGSLRTRWNVGSLVPSTRTGTSPPGLGPGIRQTATTTATVIAATIHIAVAPGPPNATAAQTQSPARGNPGRPRRGSSMDDS